MKKETVINWAKNKDTVSFSMVQEELGVNFDEAVQIIKFLIRKGIIVEEREDHFYHRVIKGNYFETMIDNIDKIKIKWDKDRAEEFRLFLKDHLDGFKELFIHCYKKDGTKEELEKFINVFFASFLPNELSIIIKYFGLFNVKKMSLEAISNQTFVPVEKLKIIIGKIKFVMNKERIKKKIFIN